MHGITLVCTLPISLHFETNVICRKVEGELFPALMHYGIRFYAYNPVSFDYHYSYQ